MSGPVSDDQRQVLDRLHAAYNMKQHTKTGSDQEGVLTPAFIDEFAAVGSVDRVVEKLRQVEALGIDKVIITGPSIGCDREHAAESRHLMVNEVIPALA